MKRLIVFVLALIVFPSAAAADIIIFKSGSAKEGIIEEETPKSVKIRVKNKVVGISRSNIERIEFATPEENEELALKWKMDEVRREEERKQRREERERFEREQRAKGLEKMGERWISPAEAEAMRQRAILEEETEQVSPEEGESVAPAEETGLPDFIMNMPEEQREQYLSNVKKIEVGTVSTDPVGAGQTRVRGEVTNGSEYLAQSVRVDISCYNETGEKIYSGSQVLRNVKSNQSKRLNVSIPVNSRDIKRLDVRVVDAILR